MSRKSVFRIATARLQAERIIDQLKAAAFSNNDISAPFPDTGRTRNFAHEKNTKTPEGSVTGGVIGGALGWIAGIGALAIPGVGSFIAAALNIDVPPAIKPAHKGNGQSPMKNSYVTRGA
jgi:hypothetical protein